MNRFCANLVSLGGELVEPWEQIVIEELVRWQKWVMQPRTAIVEDLALAGRCVEKGAGTARIAALKHFQPAGDAGFHALCQLRLNAGDYPLALRHFLCEQGRQFSDRLAHLNDGVPRGEGLRFLTASCPQLGGAQPGNEIARVQRDRGLQRRNFAFVVSRRPAGRRQVPLQRA
ncbi:hypothetical protein [Novosphingobium sp. ST904]|uniref:hypothetical protein n=1 Tax=Novosphingobium sp. ST904 TaxID=1684385 RepID=UPI001FB34A6B|nr:hypothetical protein [Novosphingobium sp. ST904]